LLFIDAVKGYNQAKGENHMNILVVYDSAYGNTESIAKAIGSSCKADVLRVGEVKAEQLRDLDVLIVGSPTQAFRSLPSVKSFLKNLPAGSLKNVKVASFDTRVDVKQVGNRFLTFLVRLFGYAAQPIMSTLVKKGGVRAVPPMGFIVNDKEGPLRDGEIERAIQWSKEITI
jgi:flavodoxin